MLARADVAAVYIATPTAANEEIALAAIAAGKHVLIDKPFLNHASLLRMTNAAAAKNVAFMDATHFVHHPRTTAIRKASAEKIGAPRSLHTAFSFHFQYGTTTRSELTLIPMEPTGYIRWSSFASLVAALCPYGLSGEASTVRNRFR